MRRIGRPGHPTLGVSPVSTQVDIGPAYIRPTVRACTFDKSICEESEKSQMGRPRDILAYLLHPSQKVCSLVCFSR
jgi:hypothetical protein